MSAPTQAPVLSAIFLALLCSACSPSGSSQTAGGEAAAVPAAPAAQAVAVSYEIVTETRPKDFAAYRKFQEDAYTLCANTLKLSQRAVVPMTEVSPDSSLTRETWTSDGKSFLYKSEVQALGLPDLEAGCQQKPGRSIEYRLTQADGSRHHWGEDAVRGPTPLSSEAALEQMPPLPTPSYSREKTVNGIALRCPSAEEMRLVAQVAEETCFIDTLGGHRVRDADGRLIGAYTVSQFAGAALHVVQVPISAKVQLAVNPALFKKP